MIGGSLFRHKRIHKATWISPDHHTENQIDHITICKEFRRSLQDTRVRRGADAASDHHLVVGRLKLKLKRFFKTSPKPSHRYNTALLKDAATRDKFTLELSNRFQALSTLSEEAGSAEEMWEKSKTAWKKACDVVLGKRTSQHREWLSVGTLAKIAVRREKKAALNIAKTRAAKAQRQAEYTEANKEVKKSARMDKRNFIEGLAQEAEDAAGKGNMKEVYRITKKLSGKRSISHHQVHSKDGKLLTAENEQLNRWREYFEELLNRPPPAITPNIPPANTLLNIKTEPPSKREIRKALQHLKNDKAPGPDGIPPEALKIDMKSSVDSLHKLFERIWNTEQMPEDWKCGHLVKLPKKGSLKECANWRGITLLSIPGKVFSRVLLERMKKEVEAILRDEQAGFRQERSCTDQIATLRMILEQSLEWNTSLYVVFIDYEKAFDSVDRSTLWKLLQHYGIPKKIIRMIRLAYEPSTCQVIHGNTLTEPFTVLSGVRQGCLLSPFLFLLVMDWIMKETTKDQARGIQWTLSKHLEDIDFADDVALLSQRHNNMTQKLESIRETAAMIGLKVNTQKTKSLRVNQGNNAHFNIGGDEIQDVEKFTYLGSIVSSEGGTDQDIVARIGKATTAFNILRPIWRSRAISVKTKLRIFNTNVKSVLLYACETWRVTKASNNRIQTFVNRCLRHILRVRWQDKVRNEDLWKRAEQQPLHLQVRKRKWRWLGHTLRKPFANVTRHALRWTPQGKRNRGRPKTTWRRSTDAEVKQTGMSWNQLEKMAKDRGRWRSLVDDLCSNGNLRV